MSRTRLARAVNAGDECCRAGIGFPHHGMSAVLQEGSHDSATAIQSASGSTVEKLRSVKSGISVVDAQLALRHAAAIGAVGQAPHALSYGPRPLAGAAGSWPSARSPPALACTVQSSGSRGAGIARRAAHGRMAAIFASHMSRLDSSPGTYHTGDAPDGG